MPTRRHNASASVSGTRAPHAIIGLSTSEMRTPERVYHDPQGEPIHQRELALGLTYPEAIRRAGAVPVVIPPLDVGSIEPLLDGLSGLCLSGGPDLDPFIYGAEPHPALGPTEPHLDVFEIALVRAAEARELPVLAICRGLQVLNVARGGTLVQDLPSERPSDIEHRQEQAPSIPTHDVILESGSLISAYLGTPQARVNSFHHQAVDRLGSGLKAVGWASDGTVEAIEATDRAFTVAVQWHAESMTQSPEQARLMSAFTHAASTYGLGAVRAA
jgi:putative glutamine amidotransferase